MFITLGFTWNTLPILIWRAQYSPFGKDSEMAMLEIVGLGEASVPRVIYLLQHGNDRGRTIAAAMLGEIRSQKAVHSLIVATNDPNESVQINAIVALGEIGDKCAIPSLIDKARAQGQKADCAISALGKIGDTTAVPFLIEIAEKEILKRSSAVFALGEIGDTRVLPILYQFLLDKDPFVRKYSITAICRIKYDEAFSLFCSNDPDIRNLVIGGLITCISIGKIESIKRTQEVLIEALSDTKIDRKLRYRVIGALGKIGDATAIPVLDSLKENSKHINFREAAAEAILKIESREKVKAKL